ARETACTRVWSAISKLGSEGAQPSGLHCANMGALAYSRRPGRHKRSALGSRPANYRLSLYPLGIAQGVGPHRMPTTPLIAYAHVGKTFDDGRVVAVDDVSLEVAEGEFLAIVGGSGSGKTTLLRATNRLIEADGGTITVEGEDVRNVDPIPLRRRIGYVFQSGGLFPPLTLARSVGLTPQHLRTDS